MRRVLIFHRCGHAEWHELPPMSAREFRAVKDRFASMDCPACWSGDTEDYESMRRPKGDGTEEGGRK